MESDVEHKDYSAQHDCFGRYCEPGTPWDPLNQPYILCCHCSRMAACVAEKQRKAKDE